MINLFLSFDVPVNWSFGCLEVYLFSNLNIEVTALLAFSSVSGVAIALASKDTVEISLVQLWFLLINLFKLEIGSLLMVQ